MRSGIRRCAFTCKRFPRHYARGREGGHKYRRANVIGKSKTRPRAIPRIATNNHLSTNVLSGGLRQFRERSRYPMQTGRAERVSSLGAPRRFQLNYKVARELSINVFKPDTYGRSRFAAIGAE